MRRMKRGSPRRPAKRSSSPTCRSSTRIIICGSGPDHRYLLHEFLADLRTGHNVVATVFVECHAMYRADGPEEMRPVGETEFVAGIAAMSDSGGYGADARRRRHRGLRRPHARRPGRAGAGGASSAPAAGASAACATPAAWDAEPDHRQQPSPRDRTSMQRADFRAGLARLTALGLSLDAWVFHPAARRRRSSWRAPSPTRNIIMGHVRRAARLRPLCRQARRGVRVLEGRDHGAGHVPERGHEARRHDDAAGRVRLRRAAGAAVARHELAGCWRPYIETCIELFGADRCMFESNFPVEKMGIGWAALWNAFKRIAAGASADEKLALFSGTARRIYRLE